MTNAERLIDDIAEYLAHHNGPTVILSSKQVVAIYRLIDRVRALEAELGECNEALAACQAQGGAAVDACRAFNVFDIGAIDTVLLVTVPSDPRQRSQLLSLTHKIEAARRAVAS